jgi:hypothetical protein
LEDPMSWTQWPEFLKKRYALANGARASAVENCSFEFAADSAVFAKDAIEWAYAVLTTLDAKASALMRLNGVLIAAAAFMLGLFGRVDKPVLATEKGDAFVIVLAALLSAVSMFLCLFVVNVSWKFLGKVVISDKKYSFGAEINRLYKAIRFRETAYQAAWVISWIAALGFVGEFARQAIFVIYYRTF